MDDFDSWLIGEYRRVVGELLERDPGALAARAGRRRRAGFADPPRAWCLAVRASDRRLSPMNAAMWANEDWGAGPLEAARGETGERFCEHSVELDGGVLKEICRPVVLRPHTDWLDVARELGVHPENLRYAMRKGFYDIKYIAGLGGREGPPVPHLYTPEQLDPSSSNMHRPQDALWGSVWTWAAGMVPKELKQVVVRRAVYRRYRRRDGRSEERFRGWVWVCPGCGRGARTIFYPLPRFTIPKFLGKDFGEGGTTKARRHEGEGISDFKDQISDFKDQISKDGDGAGEVSGCFGCLYCHRIKYFTRVGVDAWNYFVGHVTGGLVYGREIPRPGWMAPGEAGNRRRARRGREVGTPRVLAAAARRAAVLEGLLAGETLKGIAGRLGMGFSTVCGHAARIYRERGVKGRRELESMSNVKSRMSKVGEGVGRAAG